MSAPATTTERPGRFADGAFSGDDLLALLTLTVETGQQLACCDNSPLRRWAERDADDAEFEALAFYVRGVACIVRAYHGSLPQFFQAVEAKNGGVPLYDVAELLSLHVQVAAGAAEASGERPTLLQLTESAGLAMARSVPRVED